VTRPSAAQRILAAPAGYDAGEAAIGVADMAPADTVWLIDALGLTGAAYRWDLPRVARVTLEKCCHGRAFSANNLRGHVPARARHLIQPAFTWLLKEGLITATGTSVVSVAPGARGRRAACYQLTPVGELLSRELAPPPGMDALPLPDLNRMTAPPVSEWVN
jgi:hypothetical protein